MRLFTLNVMLLGSDTGLMEYDLMKVVTRLNRGRRPQFRFISSGETIDFDGSTIDILWPPRTLDSKVALRTIRRSIEDFDKAMEEDAIIRELYQRMSNDSLIDDYLDDTSSNDNPGSGRHDDVARVEQEIEIYPKSFRRAQLPKLVAKANESIREAANHLAVIASQDNRLLFFGDAEKLEISRVVNDLVAKGRTKYYVLITPHHGTHWHDRLGRLVCVHAISSNGPKLHSKTKSGFKDISRMHHVTYWNGDISVPRSFFSPTWY